MKYSEFYKLIESAGWTISRGKKQKSETDENDYSHY